MIKFTITSEEGRTMLGIVLLRENLERLVQDKSIHISREEIKIANIDDIYIGYYPDMNTAMKALEPLIGNKTTVHAIPHMPEKEQ